MENTELDMEVLSERLLRNTKFLNMLNTLVNFAVKIQSKDKPLVYGNVRLV